MAESEEKASSGEKTKPVEEKTNARPGYTYAATFGQPSEQFVKVKLEIDGQVKVVAVCALCHKAFRLCSLDQSVTEQIISKAKYLGLADADGQDKTSTDQKDGKDSAKDATDSKDANKSAASTSPTPSSSTTPTDDKKKAEEEKKKKKKEGSDQKRKTLPPTSWTTNKPRHDDWDKKKKKDF